jgi:drug/metabolite transporter (DMT)-like permease
MENTSLPSTAAPTPHISVYGGLLLIAGLSTVVIALGEKSRIAAIIGAVITIIGIVCVAIGNRRKKRQARQEGGAHPAV